MKKKETPQLKTINLRMHQVRALRQLTLSKDIMNTEALMLILNKKYKSHNGFRMLFKYLDMQDDYEVMNRKTKILSYLNYSNYQYLDELIIPDHSVYVDSSLAGFAMPLIEDHTNLGKIVNDSNISFKDKKKYLIELGKLISKVHKMDDEHEMLFADLNEYNFIIDKEDELKAIDLDSSYVDNLGITPSHMAYYLLKNKYISSIPDKYPTTSKGIIIPTKNSDLYCYNMIILDAIADEAIFKQDISTFYEYIYYLEDLGIPKDVLNVFRRIYIPKDNINPSRIIDLIPDDISEDATFQSFQKKLKKY